MAKITETVLYYNPGTPEAMKHVALLKSVLVRMGIRIRNIGPDQVMETVGYLAGVEGFTAAETKEQAEKAGTEETKDQAEQAEPAGPDLAVIPVQMMVLKQFSDKRLNELLVNLRKAGVPKVELKAVLTENNSRWTFYHLYEELKEEHEAMTAGTKQ